MVRAALADEGGYVLVWAIVAFVVLGALAAASLRSSQVQRDDARSAVEWNESFFAAESGLRALLADADSLTDGLATGDSVIVGWTTLTGTAQYKGSIQRVDDDSGQKLYQVTSTGTGGGLFGGRTELRMVFGEASQLPSGLNAAAGDFELVDEGYADSYRSDDGPYGPGNKHQNADVFANGNVSTPDGGWIEGDATAVGTASGNVSGTQTSGAPPRTFEAPECPLGPYTSFKKVEKTVTLGSGTYYFTDFVMRDEARLKINSGDQVVVHVSGRVLFRDAQINYIDRMPADLIIYGCGSNTETWLLEESSVWAAIYAPNHPVRVIDATHLYGSLTGQGTTLGGSEEAYFHQDESLKSIGGKRFSPITLRSWSQAF